MKALSAGVSSEFHYTPKGKKDKHKRRLAISETAEITNKFDPMVDKG